MKVKVIVAIFLSFICFIGFSIINKAESKIDVPEMAKNAFQQKFPTAKKVEWELEREGEYEAEFVINSREYSANFKSDGRWLEAEVKIEKKDLPNKVMEGITTKFPNFRIEEVEQVEKPNTDISYEIELVSEADGKGLEAIFTLEGVFVKKEMLEEEEEH